ncbi:MAG: addiction module toxin RelE [Bacteroidales bacterium]|nr:addiction module toxin RelE [Bacteroidales bacterium]
MEYKFFVTKEFERVMKRLSKKYRSLPSDFANFKEEFISKYPQIGVDLANGYKKVRMEITSKGKGKSAGARVITYDLCIKVEEKNILIVTMFDKSEYDNT